MSDSPVVYYLGRKYRIVRGPHTERRFGEVQTRVTLMDIDGYKVSAAPDMLTPVNKLGTQA